MVRYVKTIHVQYDNPSNAIEGGNVNRGVESAGEYHSHLLFELLQITWAIATDVYLVAEYAPPQEAASGFSLLTTYNEDLTASSLSKGDGKPLHHYIRILYSHDRSQVVAKVWFSRTKDTQEGDGRTSDINRDRGGEPLYLCWEYDNAMRRLPQADPNKPSNSITGRFNIKCQQSLS